MFDNTVVVFLVILSACAAALHSLRFKPSPYINALLGVLALFSVWFYTEYGHFHWVKKTDPTFMEANHGSSDKRTYFHWHEIYHYYLGAKYYPELNNYGLYEAVALADHESGNQYIQVPRVRDLSNKLQSITYTEALERARTIYKPRFTEARWKEFSDDLAYMKSIAPRDWLDLGMYDAGFNPTPAWCVIGTPLANLLPITPPSTSLPATWDKAELLPLIDVVLLLIALGFIWHTFGTIPLLLFVITFGTSFVASERWIAGSFLRYPWLVTLIIGICMMRKER